MPTDSDAADLARRLADNAEAVCRQYLSNGRRDGRHWRVGDARNTAGRSMFVRLVPGDGKPAGKWTDAATLEHGDLLDIIREACGFRTFREAAEEARRFLALPRPDPPDRQAAVRLGSPDAARRLFDAGTPVRSTLVETYLGCRGISLPRHVGALRFHPRCYYRPDPDAPKSSRPAMLAAVTDLSGTITGVHRTWMESGRSGQTPEVFDRRAMGHLLGHGVRFGRVKDVLVAGEGIETTLSLGEVMPAMPLLAALSAAHLGAIAFPPALKRLYVARDQDAAGDSAFARIQERAVETGIAVVGLRPHRGDFNDDLRQLGQTHLVGLLRQQLDPADIPRFLPG